MNKSVFSFLQATDNAALPTIAAACHAAARLLLSTGGAAIDQYLLPAGPTAANPLQLCVVAKYWDRRTDKRPTAT